MTLWRRILVERRAVVFPLLVVLLANVAVYVLLVLPLEHSVTSAGEESMQAMGDLARARREGTDARNAQTSSTQADDELNKFYQGVLATTFQQARNIADFWLDRTARESGVTKRDSEYDYQLVKDSKLVRVQGTVSLEGSYGNIRRFLYAAETAKEFIVIEKVELSETGANVGGGNDSLSVKLNLSTYYVAADSK